MLGSGSRQVVLMIMLGLVCAMCGTTMAQNPASASLESQLETIYKLTQLEGNTHTVIAPGTLLRLAKTNLLYETPMDNMFRCNAMVKGDKQQIPGGGCLGITKGLGTFLQAGQLLYITKIKVNTSKDTISFELVEAAAGADGNAAWPTFKTGVNFAFDSGFLAKADAGQVADEINTVLPLDNGGDDSSQGAGQQAAVQPKSSPAESRALQPVSQTQAPVGGAQVQVGMTEDQVRSILGQPTVSRNYGGTTVFMYQKMITFQNGKVSAIQ